MWMIYSSTHNAMVRITLGIISEGGMVGMAKLAIEPNMSEMTKSVAEIGKGVRRSMGKSNFIYGASAVSILLSLFMVRRNPVMATFIGLWAPTILGLGTLFKENKILQAQGKT